MKISLRPQSDGIALLIVMCAIFVLSILAAGLAFSMKVESRLAIGTDTNQRLVWLGRSGVEYCRWVLAQERCPNDSLNQQWAGGPGSVCDNTNMAFANPVELGDGSFTWKITDLERFGNINNPLDAPEITQALTLMGVDAGQISVVSDSIQDWVQAGDMPRIAGAKDEYYLGLPTPYNCRSAPMDDISELLLVKGIWDHPEIYNPKTYGGNATSRRPAAFQRHQLGVGNAPGAVPDYPFGLADLFTPFSSGRVNVNTADKNVLQMVLMTTGMDVGTAGNWADAIIQWRSGPDRIDGTSDDTPFLGVQQLTAAGVTPAAVAQLGRLCDVRSTTFKVTITARIGTFPPRDFNAILYRPPGTRNVQVVRFYWDY